VFCFLYFHDPSLRAHYFMDDLFTGEHKDEQNQLCKEGIDGTGRGREGLQLPLSPRFLAVSYLSVLRIRLRDPMPFGSGIGDG
jgi:hypothetical protein